METWRGPTCFCTQPDAQRQFRLDQLRKMLCQKCSVILCCWWVSCEKCFDKINHDEGLLVYHLHRGDRKIRKGRNCPIYLPVQANFSCVCRITNGQRSKTKDWQCGSYIKLYRWSPGCQLLLEKIKTRGNIGSIEHPDQKKTDEKRTSGWRCHSNSVSCIHWFAHRETTEARTITSSDHLWRKLCWRWAASCASLICCLKMLLIGLCCWMNKLYSCCFLDENPLGGWSAAVHLGTEEWEGV